MEEHRPIVEAMMQALQSDGVDTIALLDDACEKKNLSDYSSRYSGGNKNKEW